MSEELENRFYEYARRVRDFCGAVKKNLINNEYITQLIRASSSVGANYIEASDDLGRSDERLKIKISRTESKESVFWLRLILTYDDHELETERQLLINEGTAIRKILSAILIKLH